MSDEIEALPKRTTIKFMCPSNPAKNRFKYCFEMAFYGGNERAELEAWCEENHTREWGNMGYVSCQTDEDAIEFINKWGINHHRSYNSQWFKND